MTEDPDGFFYPAELADVETVSESYRCLSSPSGMHELDRTVRCRRCPAEMRPERVRRNRNNRKRGGAAELDVATRVGGRKMGPLGLPWDVEIPGFLRLQVKKLARWPSLASAVAWLDAIPAGREMRGVAIVEAAGQGVKPRRLLVLDLDEFSAWYGDLTRKDGAA